MSNRFFNFVKFSLAFSCAAFLISAGILKAQRNSGEVQISDRNGKPVVLYQESHALVIWSGNYQHWSKLNNVESEAQQVVKALKQQGFQVTIVANPTGENFKREVDDFIANYGYKPNNRLVIFYTGHGTTRHQDKGYIVPVDAPDPTLDEIGFLRVAISMENVMTWAKIIEAKHVLFVFDSCFSGTLFKMKSLPNLDNSYINTIMDKPVRQFLTAGDAGQEVPAKSIFTPLFIRAIEGEADYTKDGYVTGNELGVYLTQNLSKYTKSQSPQYGKIRDVDLDRGDIIFRPPTETIASVLPSPSPKPSPISIPTTVATPPPSRQSKPSPRPSVAVVPKPKQTPSPVLSRPGTTLISKSTGVNYTNLRDLLAQGKWKEADEETYRVMVLAAKRETQGWLRDEDYETFSCEDLRIIDQLWLSASEGKFGFSVQKQIYESLGGTREYNEGVWQKFGDRVGWRKGGNWLDYWDLTFNVREASPAHLPTLGKNKLYVFWWRLTSSLVQRFVTCSIK